MTQGETLRLCPLSWLPYLLAFASKTHDYEDASPGFINWSKSPTRSSASELSYPASLAKPDDFSGEIVEFHLAF